MFLKPILARRDQIENKTQYFEVYGCHLQLSGDSSSAIDMVSKDFQFFTSEVNSNFIKMELVTKEPPYHEIPDGVATTYTPRNVSFTKDDITYIDYGGQALVIWNRKKLLFQIFTLSMDLQYEATYLFMLSRIGESLDGQKMHRIHAMAMSVNGHAVLVVLPMGGGKSTLASTLLSFPEFKFLSDDSPFISADGNLHAFPLRLGLLPGSEQDIPVEMRRTIRRMEFGPKIVVDYDYFADKVQPMAKPGIVFLGQRSLSSKCNIEPTTRWERIMSMITHCVVGIGLYQGLEFVLNHNVIELVSKVGVAKSRLTNVRKLFGRSEVHRLILGRDINQNAETVRKFVNDRLGELKS